MTHPSASDSFATLALYKFTYLLTYLLTYLWRKLAVLAPPYLTIDIQSKTPSPCASPSHRPGDGFVETQQGTAGFRIPLPIQRTSPTDKSPSPSPSPRQVGTFWPLSVPALTLLATARRFLQPSWLLQRFGRQSLWSKAYITIAIRLRYNYDTTMTKNWHVHFLRRIGSRRTRYVVVGS